MKKILAIVITLLCVQSAFAGRAADTLNGSVTARTVDTFVYVPPDASLKISGMTREEYNRKDPKSEQLWRKAWTAEGKSWDKGLFKMIRKDTSRPTN